MHYKNTVMKKKKILFNFYLIIECVINNKIEPVRHDFSIGLHEEDHEASRRRHQFRQRNSKLTVGVTHTAGVDEDAL